MNGAAVQGGPAPARNEAAASLRAKRPTPSRFGWLLFLLSNGAWIAYGIKVGAHGLVAMQIGFTLTSLMGVYRWLVAAKM
jgi:hypothetical protein